MKCVVLLPGIMGSALQLNGENVWPPTIGEMIGGYDRIDQLIDPAVKEGGIIRNVSFFGVYKSLLRDIDDCGYKASSNVRKFIAFGYDWRKSNAISAESLASHLDAELPDEVDDLEIVLIGHSMGGIVLRYFLESGNFSDRRWFGKIKTLITLGSPHFGAPTALTRLLGNEPSTSVSGPDVHKLTTVQGFSSLYEMAAIEMSALTVTSQKRGEIPKGINPFGQTVAQAYNLSAHNINLAEEFWENLDLSKRPEHVEYFFFAGSSHKTQVRNYWSSGDQKLNPVTKKQSGDGTVPFVSAALIGIPHDYSTKKHASIFTDRKLRGALFDFLDAPATAKPHSAEDSELEIGDSEAIGLSVNQDIYSKGESIEVAISYMTEQTNPSEAFGIIAINPDDETEETVKSILVKFEGVALKNFTFTLVEDLEPGAYELRSNREVDDPEPTIFFVTNQATAEEGEE